MPKKLHFEVVPLSEIAFTSCEPDRRVVLVVDDEPLVAETLAKILSKAGFEALPAYNATDALEAARERPPEFLLTDVWMPGMNGIELAMQVTKEFPGCGILLFSGNATRADLESARMAGYEFPLMEKPIHPAELLRYIGDCFDGRLSSMDGVEVARASMWETMRDRAS